MKLLIAGLATGLLLSGAPAWADSWKNESGHGWRGIHREQPRSHRENRWERQQRQWERHHRQRERFARRWERRHEHFNDRYYYAPPVTRHHYYYRDYSYRYPAPEAYIAPPSVYFSWSNSYD